MFAREFIDVEGASRDSRIQEWRSSSMSRCFRAKEAVFRLDVVEAVRWVRRFVKRRRTSKGSAIVDGCCMCARAYVR